MHSKLVVFLKFFCLAYLVFLIPKIISFYSTDAAIGSRKRLHALLGVEHFVDGASVRKSLKLPQYGLICGNTSFDQNGNRSVDLLCERGISIKKIFVKDGNKDRKVFPTNKGRDVATGIPLYFLRGNIRDFLARNDAGVDAILLDIQDSGVSSSKIETFLRSLLSYASSSGKRLVVLDRPALLGGIIEGSGEIPWRYGLTIGELVRYFNRYVVKDSAHVTVIPLKRWRRGSKLRRYAGENRPTGGFNPLPLFFRPFHHVNPIFTSYNKPREFYMMLLGQKEKLSTWETRYLKRLCWHLGLHCLDYSFTPESNTQSFEGVRLALKEDISRFSAFNTILTIMRFFKNRKQVGVVFNGQFDESIGSGKVKDFLNGVISFDVLKEIVDKSLTSFYDKAKHCCLYKPLPKVVSPKIVKV